ncbi:phage tail termination protein [Streptomyces tsukubensis]
MGRGHPHHRGGSELTAYLLPDSEAIVTEAVQHYLERDFAAKPVIRVAMPADWYDRMPLVVIRRSSGTARVPAHLDAGVFTAHAFHSTRRDASLLARQVRAALLAASAERFRSRTEPGRPGLSHVQEVTGPLYSPGDSQLVHPDVHRFVASYIVSTHR